MLEAIEHPCLVGAGGGFDPATAPTNPDPESLDHSANKKALKRLRRELSDLQEALYADDRYAVLLVFQAMDAAGKDGTIRAVLTGVNPAGCQVFSFKEPSEEELDHDFLWRTGRSLPERGRIGVFNRSYYEEVLIVRVHPEILESQDLPLVTDEVWEERLASIREHEAHLARNGVTILKFWLNVSKEEQRRRFLARIEEPEKNWKFSVRDVEERRHWDAYMAAYREAINATSFPWAPWYAIPADDKAYMRRAVAEIIVDTLRTHDLRFPEIDAKARDGLARMRSLLKEDEA